MSGFCISVEGRCANKAKFLLKVACERIVLKKLAITLVVCLGDGIGRKVSITKNASLELLVPSYCLLLSHLFSAEFFRVQGSYVEVVGGQVQV